MTFGAGALRGLRACAAGAALCAWALAGCGDVGNVVWRVSARH